jgi:predicted nucleic acid-binding protein
MRAYLDICCLKRPFDDQSQARVRLECEAILALLGSSPETEFVRSVAHDLENDQNPLLWRAERVRRWLRELPVGVSNATALEARTTALMGMGFRGFDALHIACAEAAKVDVFITCDDRLLAVARRLSSSLEVKVADPLVAAKEMLP